MDGSQDYKVCCLLPVGTDADTLLAGGGGDGAPRGYYFAHAARRILANGFACLGMPASHVSAAYVYAAYPEASLSLETIGSMAQLGKVAADVAVLDDDAIHALLQGSAPGIHLLKADATCLSELTRCDDPQEAALMLAAAGVREVVITQGARGSLLYTRGMFAEVPAYPTLTVSAPYGCGETYLAGYLARRALGISPYDAGCFASAMCALKLQGEGTFSADEATVLRMVKDGSTLRLTDDLARMIGKL